MGEVLKMAVVVAQLVEQSLLTPNIHSLNDYISKIKSTNCSIYKKKIKKGPSVKKYPKRLNLYSD